MKKMIIVLLVFGISYASDMTKQPSLSQRRKLNFNLELQPLPSSHDAEETTVVRETIPSPARRQRGREVSLLSQKILNCKTEEEFKSLCLEVDQICNKYRNYLDRVDFVEVDGPVMVGRDIVNNLLISGLRETAQNNHWSLLQLPDLSNIKNE